MKRFHRFICEFSHCIFSSWNVGGKYIPLVGGVFLFSAFFISNLSSEEGFAWGVFKDIFPCNLLWTPVGEGEVVDFTILPAWRPPTPLREERLGIIQTLKEHPEFQSRGRTQGLTRGYHIKYTFQWADDQGRIHCGKCYTLSAWKGDSMEVVAWLGKDSTVKFRGTTCTPAGPGLFYTGFFALALWIFMVICFVRSDVRTFRKIPRKKRRTHPFRPSFG